MSDDEHWVGQIVEYVTEQIRAERDAAIARAEAAEAQVAKLRETLEELTDDLNRTRRRAQAGEAVIDRLADALAEYTIDANWQLGRRFDPNSSAFDGIDLARAALAGKEPAHD